MRKEPLEEGEVWIVACTWEPYNGYGTTILDAINPRNNTAISCVMEHTGFIKEGDAFVVFSSSIVEFGSCVAHLIRPRDLFKLDVTVKSASFWDS